MPMICVKCNCDVPQAVLSELSAVTAAVLGKPEQYVMVLSERATIQLGGSGGPAAFVDVRSIGGLNGTVNAALSEKVCSLLTTKLAVPQNRIYITFTSFTADSWGWNGSTFG